MTIIKPNKFKDSKYKQFEIKFTQKKGFERGIDIGGKMGSKKKVEELVVVFNEKSRREGWGWCLRGQKKR